MLEARELEEHGKVEICKEVNNKFHVKITEGFSTNARKTYKLMGIIEKAVGFKYPIVDMIKTDDNWFEYILKAKS